MPSSWQFSYDGQILFLLCLIYKLEVERCDRRDDGQILGESSYHRDAMTLILSIFRAHRLPSTLMFSHYESLFGGDCYICTGDR